MIQQMLAIWSLVGNLTSGSSAFSKTSLNIREFIVHVLLKSGLENFEHYFTSIWDECNCVVVWAFFCISFLWDWNENWPFPVNWMETVVWLERAVLDLSWLWGYRRCVCPLIPSCNTYHLTWVFLTLDLGVSLHGCSMLSKCYTQYASKFGKLSSGHRTGKGQFLFQSQRKAMPKNAQTTA